MENRCEWAKGPLLTPYHDQEWGVPVHDETKLFEFLILDCFQAGLSWDIILAKRENFRQALAGFDPEAVARFGDRDKERLLADKGIVRNRAKIEASVANARAVLALREEKGGLDGFMWSFTGGRTIHNQWQSLAEIPAQTTESQAMAKELKARGFRFVGPTICYAVMQSMGMVNDHLVHCFRHAELARIFHEDHQKV